MHDHPTVSLSLTVNNGVEALAFYEKALGAETIVKMEMPDGGLAHGQFRVGNTDIWISNPDPNWSAEAFPEGIQAACLFSVVVENCDASHQRALEAGMQSLSEPADQFWGHRSSIVLDPYGYRWSFSHVVETLSMEEIERRAAELMQG